VKNRIIFPSIFCANILFGSSSVLMETQNEKSTLLRDIEIVPNPIEVEEKSTVHLHAIGHYDGGKTRDLSASVRWSAEGSSTAKVDAEGTFQALKEGMAIVTAAMGSAKGGANITVYKVIHGHRLPPEPDTKVNNSTLLGIDSNNNGVRDDVERHIYLCGKYEHPVVRAVALQAARAFQIVIADASKAKNSVDYLEAAMDCESYYRLTARHYGEDTPIDRKRRIWKEVQTLQIDNAIRRREYKKFNSLLSGDVYSLTKMDQRREKCDFNTTLLSGE